MDLKKCSSIRNSKYIQITGIIWRNFWRGPINKSLSDHMAKYLTINYEYQRRSSKHKLLAAYQNDWIIESIIKHQQIPKIIERGSNLIILPPPHIRFQWWRLQIRISDLLSVSTAGSDADWTTTMANQGKDPHQLCWAAERTQNCFSPPRF